VASTAGDGLSGRKPAATRDVPPAAASDPAGAASPPAASASEVYQRVEPRAAPLRAAPAPGRQGRGKDEPASAAGAGAAARRSAGTPSG